MMMLFGTAVLLTSLVSFAYARRRTTAPSTARWPRQQSRAWTRRP